VGVAIGDWIVDLAALEGARLLSVRYTVVDDDGNPKRNPD
jgi:fumarylacetoacetase